MTKPRLAKVRALLYVLHHIKKEAAPILTQPLFILRESSGLSIVLWLNCRVIQVLYFSNSGAVLE